MTRDPERLQPIERLFVYGTLRAGFGNHGFMRGSTFVKDGWLEGYVMYGHGVPHLERGKGRVYGEIYDVPRSRILGEIDDLEGHPIGYTRTWEEQLDGCWVYIFTRHANYGQRVESGIFKDQTREQVLETYELYKRLYGVDYLR